MSSLPLASLKRRRPTSPDNGAKGPQPVKKKLRPMKPPTTKRRQRLLQLLRKRKQTMAAENRSTLRLFGASVSMMEEGNCLPLKTLEGLQGKSFCHPRTNLKCSSFQTITAVTNP